MKFNIIIADDEILICRMIVHMITTSGLELEIQKQCYDGEELLNAIMDLKPHIVITDISMPRLDGLEVIKRISTLGLPCKFIIISGYRQFEYAYNALKYGVDDYILKPIDESQLISALSRMIRKISEGSLHNDSNALRRFFSSQGIKSIENKGLSRNEINAKYCTSFSPGCFRTMIIKLDYHYEDMQIPENISSLQAKIETIVQTCIGGLCYDLLFENLFSGSKILMNYPKDSAEKVLSQITQIFNLSKQAVAFIDGLDVTVGLGSEHYSIDELMDSRREARLAIWMRLSKGIGKIITYNAPSENAPLSDAGKIQKFTDQLNTAYETLDCATFEKCIKEIFFFPSATLFQLEMWNFIRRIHTNFFQNYSELISTVTDPESAENITNHMLDMATSFKAYQNILITQITGIMNQISEDINHKNTYPIRIAQEYVASNYNQQIRLEDVAAKVCLSPVYFSNLFKKETGYNFSSYITEYRLKIAKDLLKNSNKNISEIAYAVGYSDIRYFSKLFKKVTGVKPTDYRRIYF